MVKDNIPVIEKAFKTGGIGALTPECINVMLAEIKLLRKMEMKIHGQDRFGRTDPGAKGRLGKQVDDGADTELVSSGTTKAGGGVAAKRVTKRKGKVTGTGKTNPGTK